ncbi:hypothetical protein ACIOHS_01180 [Streptomyces sp. NPDC088253]|uniref:hypothetical protein n=1 Tax=Streptomyces sp. NPDC088253 TaxID=3365846 RepID=UPI00381E3E43
MGATEGTSYAGDLTGLVLVAQQTRAAPVRGRFRPMTSEATYPSDCAASSDELHGQGRVEVRLVSENPEAARRVAEALRLLFAGDEQRSYPGGRSGTGARLHLTIDASHAAGPLRSWLDTSRPPADRTHHGETA